MDSVCDKLKKEYPLFVHRTIIYRQEHNHATKDVRATISGLLFVRGESVSIQGLLDSYFFGLYLSRDCATHKVACIPDGTMKSFMQIAQANPTRIRFMPHPLGYYSADNVMIRLTSGPLAGMEGFKIRISRDRCLVTSIGGLTVAVGGIHGDSFENADVYVRQRRLALGEVGEAAASPLTPIQADVASCFFAVQNQLDVMAIAASLRLRLARAERNVQARLFANAVGTSIAVLSEIGSRYNTISTVLRHEECSDLIETARRARNIMEKLLARTDTPPGIKETVETELETMPICHPELWNALAERRRYGQTHGEVCRRRN